MTRSLRAHSHDRLVPERPPPAPVPVTAGKPDDFTPAHGIAVLIGAILVMGAVFVGAPMLSGGALTPCGAVASIANARASNESLAEIRRMPPGARRDAAMAGYAIASSMTRSLGADYVRGMARATNPNLPPDVTCASRWWSELLRGY